jgi:hypothetical protein
MTEKGTSTIELEIAGILLGLVFVVESILATIPDNLIQLLQQTTFTSNYFSSIQYLPTMSFQFICMHSYLY